MWQIISDCGKQLTIHSRLRERLDNGDRLYDICEVEFDQFHLQLLNQPDKTMEDLRMVLTGDQLIEYKFEVEVK